jgi:hypothetical protein
MVDIENAGYAVNSTEGGKRVLADCNTVHSGKRVKYTSPAAAPCAAPAWRSYEMMVFTKEVIEEYMPHMTHGFHSTELSYESLHNLDLPYEVLQQYRSQQYSYCLMPDKVAVADLKINDPIAIDGIFLDHAGQVRFAQVKHHSRPIQIADLGMFLVEASRRAARGLSPPILITSSGVTAQTAAVSKEAQLRFEHVTIPHSVDAVLVAAVEATAETSDYDNSLHLRQCQTDCLDAYLQSDKTHPFVNGSPPGVYVISAMHSICGWNQRVISFVFVIW